MERIKVAIIDSGIDTNNMYFSKHMKGKSFVLDDRLENIIIGSDIKDNHGHGTACAYTILRRNNNVKIVPIKVVDSLGRTSSQCLLKALEFLLDTDIKLINISLSTVDFDYEDDFFRICNELYLKDKIIVCSMDNKFRNSLPSILPNVIGVRGKNLNFTDSYWYNKEKDIQCICDNEPILVPRINESGMTFFGHNSKSASIMTANISKILNIYNSLTFNQMNEILSKSAVKTNWTSEELKDIKIENRIVEKRFLEGNLKEKADTLCNLIIKTYNSNIEDVSFIYSYSLFNNLTNMNKHNCVDLILKIEETFKIKLDYDRISLKTFNSIYSLLDVIVSSS